MIIRVPGCYPVDVRASLAHWRPNGTKHGPKSNPKFLAFSWVKLGVSLPTSGRRLWAYFRGGYAFHADITVDRRPIKTCKHCGQVVRHV